MKKYLFIIGLLLTSSMGYSQNAGIVGNNKVVKTIADDQSVYNSLPPYPDEWNSQWITHPAIDKAA